MYDTINFWLPFEEADAPTLKILQRLSGVAEYCRQDGQTNYSGHLNNYKVSVSSQGVSLKGSLAKYFMLDNFHTLTRSDSSRAIEKMSDDLHLPIEMAKIYRIDFAQNFLMDFPPEAYYSFLGESQYYKRFSQESSLYYSNGLRQKLFYNKIKEGKSRKLPLPDVWNQQNVLRYELRFKSRLPKQLNKSEVLASDLANEQFYMSLFNKWYDEYGAINKLNRINFNLSDMKSPKDFWKQINLMAINMIGQDEIMQEVENLRNQNAFDKPEYYSRLKKEIRVLCKVPDYTSSSDLIVELDKKVKQAKKHYR